MYCKHCGSELDECETVCPLCGTATGVTPPPVYEYAPAEAEVEHDSEPVSTDERADEEIPSASTAPTASDTPTASPSTTPTVPTPPAPPKKSNGAAVAGLVFAFLFPFLGIILSGVGITNAKKQDGYKKGIAIAGLVISLVSFLGSIIAIAIVATAVGGFIGMIKAFFEAITNPENYNISQIIGMLGL